MEMEVNRVQAMERLRVNHGIDLTAGSDDPHYRQMISGQPLVQDYGLPLWRVAFDNPRQEV